MAILFQKTKLLEQQVDDYLNIATDAGLYFKRGIRLYMDDRIQEFEDLLASVRDLEHQADRLKQQVETHLYVQTLIPESRGDVLGILENMDDIINRIKSTLLEFSVEKPEIPSEYKNDYIELTDRVVVAFEQVITATRSFFKNIDDVSHHAHKVSFYEEEADTIAENLKRKVFATDLRLSHKHHLRYFTLHIDTVADLAEDLAERVNISANKRSI